MSRLRKPVSITASRESTSAPSDYVPQHPMATFSHVMAPAEESDHLDEYAEVRPFEDAEWSMKGMKKSAKKALASTKRAAKSVARKTSKFVSHKKYKRDVKRVSKIVDTIESDTKHIPNKVSAYKKKLEKALEAKEAKIKKIRDSQKDKSAFDDAVEAKLDSQEEKIYKHALE